MVSIAIKPPPRIFTGEPEDLAEELRKETETMMKKVALENNVPVEELKINFDNFGVANIQRMEPDEAKAMEIQRKQAKWRKQILERKKRL